jgi:hypothetical protein
MEEKLHRSFVPYSHDHLLLSSYSYVLPSSSFRILPTLVIYIPEDPFALPKCPL